MSAMTSYNQQEMADAGSKSETSWRHYVIYPIMGFYLLAGGMVDFVVSEYTQSVIKNETYAKSNTTFNDSITSCGNANHSDPSYTQYTHVQKQASYWIIYYGFGTGIPSIAMNFVLTSYTDVYGRRYLFILSTVGTTLKMIVIALVVFLRLPFFYIIISYVIEGCTGGYYGFLGVTFTFIADTTSVGNQRMFAVTLVEAFVLTFSVLGNVIVGVLTDNYGFLVPMLTCSLLCLVTALLIVFFLPETLPVNSRRTPTSIFRTFARTFAFYTSVDFKDNRSSYLLLLGAFFFIELNANNRSIVETMYLLGMPFCWGPSEIGYFTSVRYTAQGVIGLGLLKVFQKLIRGEILAILSALINAGTFVYEALARTDLVIFLVAIPSIFTFLSIPMIRGLMSSMTPVEKQGSLFASIATVEVTSALVATVSESSVYAATVAISNSFVFYVMAGFCVVSAGLLCIFAAIKRPTAPSLSGYEIIQDKDSESGIINGIIEDKMCVVNRSIETPKNTASLIKSNQLT